MAFVRLYEKYLEEGERRSVIKKFDSTHLPSTQLGRDRENRVENLQGHRKEEGEDKQ